MQNGTWCAPIRVLDLLTIKSGAYLNLFWVEPVGCHISAIYWAINKFAPHLVHVQSYPKNFAFLYKMEPNSTLMRVWAVRSTLFPHACLESAAGLSATGQIKQIGMMSSPPFFFFTSWATCELPFPSGCLWSFSQQWSSDCHSLTTTGCLVTATPHHCLCYFSVSDCLQAPLCHWPILFYFLECVLSA